MFTSFSTALSALSANAVGVDVIGNNLANLNTPGFKASTLSFHDLVSQSLGVTSGQNQVGLGTAAPMAVRQFTQGAVQTSGGSLDAAIQGDGFFVVHDQTERTLFTRAGNFQVSSDGTLLTSTGEKVQGWTAVDGLVNTDNSVIGDIQLPSSATLAPVATTELSLDLNLNAAGVVNQPDGTFSTPIAVVDSLGATHVVTFTFKKTDANQWDYSASIAGEDVTDGTAGSPYDLPDVTGSMQFDSNGQLTDPPADSGSIPITITGLTNGASDLTMNWSLYTPQLTPRVTQFSQPSSPAANSQNGSTAAQLTQVTLGDGGQVLAHYSNGEDKIVAQLALARIRNPESLVAVGNNNLQAGLDTDVPAIGASETGGRGRIRGGSLEASTVDIAREFTNLIVLQRSYQANARVISATDELSQETINLKR